MLNYPIVLDGSGNILAVLHQAFNIIIEDQLITASNGSDTLTFSMPLNDPKLALFTSEDRIQIADSNVSGGNRTYVVRLMLDGWDSTGTIPQKNITCEATWYDLELQPPIQPFTLTGTTATVALTQLLTDTGFSIGVVSVTAVRDFTLQSMSNPLAAVRSVPAVFGGQLEFIGAEVNLLNTTDAQSNSGLSFMYGSNMSGITRTIDTRNLITRAYLVGANNLVPTPAYIENYQWYALIGKPDVVKSQILTNSQITNLTDLGNWGAEQLNILSMPVITYDVKGVISQNTTTPDLGGLVLVHDTQLGITLNLSIAKRTYDILQPWNTTFQLNTPLQTLNDTMASLALQSNQANQSVAGAVKTGVPTSGVQLIGPTTDILYVGTHHGAIDTNVNIGTGGVNQAAMRIKPGSMSGTGDAYIQSVEDGSVYFYNETGTVFAYIHPDGTTNLHSSGEGGGVTIIKKNLSNHCNFKKLPLYRHTLTLI
jgi:phage minor structural protein